MSQLAHPFSIYFAKRFNQNLSKDAVNSEGEEGCSSKVDQLFLGLEPERQRITRFD